MVIYLVGKGSAFSPARSTTAAAMAKKKKKGAGQPPGKGAGANGRKERKIYHWCRSPRRHRLSLPLSLTAVMEVKVWPQTVRGEKKELHVNICSQRLPGLKQIHYILLVLFPPPKPIQELYLCLGSRGLQGVAWEKADSDGGHRGKVCVWSKGGEWMSNADKQRFLWPRNENKRRVDISHSKSVEGKQ